MSVCTDTPWEPPLAGTELEHLVGALDRQRTTFRWKTDDLDAARLATRVGARLATQSFTASGTKSGFGPPILTLSELGT